MKTMVKSQFNIAYFSRKFLQPAEISFGNIYLLIKYIYNLLPLLFKCSFPQLGSKKIQLARLGDSNRHVIQNTQDIGLNEITFLYANSDQRVQNAIFIRKTTSKSAVAEVLLTTNNFHHHMYKQRKYIGHDTPRIPLEPV